MNSYINSNDKFFCKHLSSQLFYKKYVMYNWIDKPINHNEKELKNLDTLPKKIFTVKTWVKTKEENTILNN